MKRSVVAVVVAAVLCLVGVPAQVQSASGSVERAAAVTAAPGLAGTPIVLATQKSFYGSDIAMGPDGTAYVGWIASSYLQADRTVFLCVLPKGATSCQGGVKSTGSMGLSSAAGLQVLPPTGLAPVTLVWFHDTVNSVTDPMGARISISTLVGGNLTGAAEQAPAPSFGSLLTAERSPSSGIWAVTQSSGLPFTTRIHQGLPAGPVKTLTPGYAAGKARLAFAGDKAVVVFDRYGPIGERVKVIYQTGTGWSGIGTVAGTWNLGGAFDVANKNGVKLVASINNASYYPRIGNWTGTTFGSFAYTGDKNSCPTYSHDLFPDASGRLADATFECAQVSISNHPKARTGAFARFNIGGTPVGEPQIGTNPRGLGWVAWARQPSSNGNTLLVAPIRLPALRTSNTNGATFGVVTVTGPVSCLPAVSTTIGVKASGRNGWSLLSKALKLDGSLHATGLNGANLAPGSTHTVTGSAKFRKSGVTRSLSASLTFKSCPNP